jgi:NAD(P)-dependent dehydrogenase (short-subunit alcohol dehydrogenase family)
VNVVSPAATETSMLQDPARAGSAPRMPPIGRLIKPAEIAALVAYLLSPAAAAITGQDIAICGGSSLNR